MQWVILGVWAPTLDTRGVQGGLGSLSADSLKALSSLYSVILRPDREAPLRADAETLALQELAHLQVCFMLRRLFPSFVLYSLLPLSVFVLLLGAFHSRCHHMRRPFLSLKLPSRTARLSYLISQSQA